MTVKMSVIYPQQEGKRFDMDYYASKHRRMVHEALDPEGLLGFTIDKGLGGGAPGSPAPYVCMGHLRFESAEVMQAAMKKHGKALMADVPNFTDITPEVQVSEVVE